MRAHFSLALAALALLAVPLAADISGITVSPVNISEPLGMTVGPDGNVWILTLKGNLGKLTPDGTYTEFPLQFGANPNGGSLNAAYLTSGADGNIWITGINGHIERVTIGGAVTDFAVAPSFFFPAQPVAGADSAIWFLDRQFPGPGVSSAWKLGRIDVLGKSTAYDLGISGDSLAGLISGGDGNLWFIDETKNQVVKFSQATNSVAGTFAIPSPSNQSSDDQTIVAWDGNVWFTRGTSIDRVTPDGTITEFHVPSGGKPAGILMAGDGSIWFTEPASGKLGQLVLSSVTNGGTATINESGSVLSGVYNFVVLPPAFAGLPVGAKALETLAANPCPPITFLGKISETGKVQKVTLPIPQCADIAVSLPVAKQRGTTGLRITSRIGNNGPDGATAFMIVRMFSFSSSSIAAATFDNVPAAKCDIGQPQPGAVECQIPLVPGEAHDLHIDLGNLSNPAQAVFFTNVQGFSDLPDPDPTNNVQAAFVNLNSVATLPPTNAPLAGPAVSPGFKPCMVNAGSVGAVGPCFGPPGTIITLLMSQAVPGGPGSLIFKSVLFSGGPADVIVPVTGSGSVYTATAPPTLCAGPFPHTWNVWLTNASGGNEGEIGQFSMTTCP